jgi:hypothetical protein
MGGGGAPLSVIPAQAGIQGIRIYCAPARSFKALGPRLRGDDGVGGTRAHHAPQAANPSTACIIASRACARICSRQVSVSV